jgi:EAL and modified HD-GYP domain-containing signal transduction protein
MNLYGYELLYRVNIDSTSFPDNVDPDTATSEAIMTSFHEFGIERVTNGKRAFINFTQKLLVDQIATILPNKILVIEILENIPPTPEVLEACVLLRKKGYVLALDDFVMNSENLPFLAVADIIKIDFLATPIDKIRPFMAAMKNSSIIFLAEKLETHQDFELAKSLGFSLFQGYFFSKPVIVTSETRLTPMKLHRMQLIALSFDPNVNFSKIANVIKQDIALSYRLFRVVNSAYFGLKYTVRNIRQALAILGMDEIKKWITLISMSELKDDKPSELITMSLIRARFLELLAPMTGFAKNADDLFMIGLLSLMDAIMDLTFEDIVARIHISGNIAEPLIDRNARYGDLLTMIIHYENSRWDDVRRIAEPYNLPVEEISNVYLQAIEWANKI